MNQERSGAAVAVHRNQIWVLGGRNSAGDILSSVEIYEPRERIWRYSCNMPKPLLLSSAVSNLGSLYIVGGLTGSKKNPIAESTIYRWDHIAQQWKYWSKLSEPRLNHTVIRYG